MYCHGAFELEHNRFTQFNLSALSKREKSSMSKPPAVFCLVKVAFFTDFGGFVTPNKVERDLVYFFTEFFRGIHDAASFESANVLILFILPAMERSLWDHIFNAFF